MIEAFLRNQKRKFTEVKMFYFLSILWNYTITHPQHLNFCCLMHFLMKPTKVLRNKKKTCHKHARGFFDLQGWWDLECIIRKNYSLCLHTLEALYSLEILHPFISKERRDAVALVYFPQQHNLFYFITNNFLTSWFHQLMQSH